MPIGFPVQNRHLDHPEDIPAIKYDCNLDPDFSIKKCKYCSYNGECEESFQKRIEQNERSKMKEYRVCMQNSLVRLEIEINKFLDMNWRIEGGVNSCQGYTVEVCNEKEQEFLFGDKPAKRVECIWYLQAISREE